MVPRSGRIIQERTEYDEIKELKQWLSTRLGIFRFYATHRTRHLLSALGLHPKGKKHFRTTLVSAPSQPVVVGGSTWSLTNLGAFISREQAAQADTRPAALRRWLRPK